MRILLRRHVLQHYRADKPNERSGDGDAQKSHEPYQRAEDKVRRRRTVHSTDGRIIRIVSRVVDRRFTMLDGRSLPIYTYIYGLYYKILYILTVTSITIILHYT